jgi:signal transduction histidine kinase
MGQNGEVREPVEHIVVLNDVTERVLAERAVRASEQKLKAVSDNMPGMAFRLVRGSDGRLRFDYASDGVQKLLGIPAPALIADAGLMFARMQPAQRQELLAGLDTSARVLSTLLWNGPMRDADGNIHWLNIQSSPHAENGEVIWDGVATDVTELKAAEADVAAARDELRELYVHVQSVREEEKASIAHEIHDELGATLAGLKYQAASLASRLQNSDAELHEHATNMSSTLGDTIGAMRRLVSGLRPPLLDELGLVAALEWQAREFASRTGIACDLSADPEIRVSPEQGIGLFRVFQESLTNVAKHAAATHIEAFLERDNGELHLQIADNGCGMGVDPDAPRASLGLRGMRERVRALGGEFAIGPGENGGTAVNVRVPVAPPSSRLVEKSPGAKHAG